MMEDAKKLKDSELEQACGGDNAGYPQKIKKLHVLHDGEVLDVV